MRVVRPRSSGSATLEAFRPLYTQRSSQGDPNGILQALTVLDGGTKSERLRFRLQGAGAVRLPDGTGIQGTFVEWLIRDVFGVVQPFGAQDLSRFGVFFHDAIALPAATYAALVTTAGGVADIGNGGAYVMIEHQALGPRAASALNAGAGVGWTARAGSSEDTLGRGAVMQVQQGNAPNNWRQNAVLVCADGDMSLNGTSANAPNTSNAGVDGRHTHMAIVVGWNSTTGAVDGAEVTVSVRELHAALRALRSMRRVPEPAPPVAPATPISRILILGDSNGEGTTASPFNGVAVTAGWIVRDEGVNIANMPAGTTPSVGGMPYYIARAIAAGAVSGNRWICRRSVNGQALTATFDGQIRDSVTDVGILGDSPQLIIIRIGANDAQDAVEAAGFANFYRRMIVILRDIWPDAIIVLSDERTTDLGVYGFLATVNAHKATINAEEGWARIGISNPNLPTPAPLADTIHFSQAAGGGHEVMANRDFDLALQLAA